MNTRCVAIHLPCDDRQMFHRKPLMLQNVMFCPALTWCVRTWAAQGVQRFFVVCEERWADLVLSCFPKDHPPEIVGPEQWPTRQSALREQGVEPEEYREPVLPLGNLMMTFHNVEELSRLQTACHDAANAYHQKRGVHIVDPASTFIDPRVDIGPDTLILPNTILRGATVIGRDCEIGPNTMLDGCTVGDNVIVNSTQAQDSVIDDGCEIGPYTHIRPHCHVGKGSKIGAFVQLKNCNLGEGTKMAHLTYVGDADVGVHCNFGCGTVTSNYDGFKKHRTTIGDNVFIGCNTNLVPPVKVEDGAYIAAGTTITRDVPADSLAVGRVRQENKEGWARRNRELKERHRR